MHVNRKRKKKAITRRKDQSVTLGHADKPHHQDLMAGLQRSYTSLSDGSGSYGLTKIGQNPTENRIDLANFANCGKTYITIPIDNLIGRVMENSHNNSRITSQSSRSTGTDILSPGTTPGMVRRWSVVGDSVILGPSVATSCAEDVAKEYLLLYPHVRVDDTMTRRKRRTASKVKNRTYRNSNRRRISRNGFTAETPATITLRKASNIYHREKLGRISQKDKIRVAKRLEAERSKSIASPSSECLITPPWEANTLSSPTQGERNEVSASLLESPRSCTLLSTSTSSSDRPILRRRTITADPALTFAEVHTTPEVFSSGGASRKHSILAIETMRRSSAVKIRSGGSIHEIIWDKEDAPSSSSSRPSFSQAGSGSSSERRSLDGSPPKTSIEPHRFQNLDFSKPASRDTEASRNIERAYASEEIAGRSWSSQQEDSSSRSVIETAAIGEAFEAEMPSRTKSKRGGRWSKSWRANINNSMQGVESFPPLLERGSTYEWQQAPLVDITEPSASPSGQSASKTTNISTAETQQKQPTPATRKPSNTTHHGIQTHGQLGTALGSSSHHRRPSTGPHQQGPYSSLVDLSKSVSRRASQITHSLSDRALDWAADRHESPPTRRLSQSADPLSESLAADNAESRRSIAQGSYAPPRKNSRGGLWITTAGMLPDSRVLRVAGLSEVAEDEVECGV
ncbi:hypothetical protein MMC32_001607 [Xylographa parallela]|nr:hypothetical protein [Xylographa parallela]